MGNNIYSPKIAHLRFYEELNDFLPQEKKKSVFPYYFINSPSIKDVIESCGVPHTQVDMILANSKSVDFNYKIHNKDIISIYPVFEIFDISSITKLKKKPLRTIRFILDVHLGKLTRYLRMLGFDTKYSNKYKIQEIITIAKNEERIIISRNRQLLKHKEITHGYCLVSSDPKTQLRKIIDYFNLYEQMEPFTRCMICNGILKSVKKKEIVDKLPKKVKEIQNCFKRCSNCSKIYWKGTHFKRMNKLIKSLGYN